jgi:uncharacterized damage-inducible protein DinB
MEIKRYLIDTFQFNDHANGLLLTKINELPDKQECLRLFSHLINSQNKWLARIIEYPKAPNLSWWDPVYALEDIKPVWEKSLGVWLDYLGNKNEEDLFAEVRFVGYDGRQWSAQLKDIALQLNYHSIHHRAQMQALIRAQGVEPDFVDYIGTRYKKIG